MKPRTKMKMNEMSRRSFLGRSVGVIAGGIALAMSASGIRYVLTPSLSKARKASPIDLEPVSAIKVNEPKAVTYEMTTRDGWYVNTERTMAWVVEYEDGSLVVFDPHCTHLGCFYHWDAEAWRFECPCHGGVFDISGKVLAGPPPRPLDRIEYKVRNGDLILLGTVVRGDNLGQYKITKV